MLKLPHKDEKDRIASYLSWHPIPADRNPYRIWLNAESSMKHSSPLIVYGQFGSLSGNSLPTFATITSVATVH